MNKVLKAGVRFLIALTMGMVYAWFALSIKWSLDDMSVLEKVVGIVYVFVMVPGYFKLTEVMGLR